MFNLDRKIKKKILSYTPEKFKDKIREKVIGININQFPLKKEQIFNRFERNKSIISKIFKNIK